MSRLVNRLSKRKAAELAAAKTPGLYPDGEGLYMQITPGGSASWLLIYRLKPRRRRMGLGPLRLVSLEEARLKRDEAHKLLMTGVDPLLNRAVGRRKQAGSVTFLEAARRYIRETEAKRKNPKSLAQWFMTLTGETPTGEKTTNNYCASLHHLPVSAIDTPEVLAVLRPIWSEKAETASRLRGRIERVLTYAVETRLAADVEPSSYRNPASWDRLQHALPSRSETREVRHHQAIAYPDVPSFYAKLRSQSGAAALALRLVILTGCRTGDVIGGDREERPPMQWEHIDLEAGVWVAPATKNGREHRTPLSTEAVEILKRVRSEHPDPSGIVFTGDKRGQPMSNGAMAAVLKRMGVEATVHGFRSCLKSWGSDCTSFDHHVVEQALAHTISGALEKAYRRTDMFMKRRALMDAWSAYVTGEARANVIVLHT
jgi:integrase